MNKIEYSLMNKCGIYIFTNLCNGNRYIGSSKNLYNRLHEHYHNLINNKHHNKHFQSAWNIYGEDMFIYGILELCNFSNQYEREQFYITSVQPEYNKTDNVIANTGTQVSKETKKQISETLKRKYKSGEILINRHESTWVPVYVYDINNYSLYKEFPNTKDALTFFNTKSAGTEFEGRIIKNQYIFSKVKFDSIEDSMNYIVPNYKYYRGNGTERKFLILEIDGKLNYFQNVKVLAETYGVSYSTLRKHLDATLEHPYIVKNVGKMYFLKEYRSKLPLASETL